MINQTDIVKIAQKFVEEFMRSKSERDLVSLPPEELQYHTIDFTSKLEDEIANRINELREKALETHKLSPEATWWENE